MSNEIKSSDSVELRLKRAEDSLAALSRGEVDVLIGKTEPLIVRFRSLVDVNERQTRLLDSLIETAPTLILLTDSRGRIIRYNRACEDNTGYSREEALERTIAELFQDPGWADAATVQTSKPSESQFHSPNVRNWLTKTGEKRSIEWRCVAGVSPENDGYYIMGIGLDITLRKLAQDAAAEARRFAENIIATVREPLLVLDNQFRVKAANRSYYKNFETDPRETMGRLLFELGNRQWDTPALRQLLQTIPSQNTSFDDFEVKHTIPPARPKGPAAQCAADRRKRGRHRLDSAGHRRRDREGESLGRPESAQ